MSLPDEAGRGEDGGGTPVLAASAVSKTFAGVAALVSLDLQIQRGEIHALLGENGSGKSTFIKILSGYHMPDPGGGVLVAGAPLHWGDAERSYAAGCRFVHQDLGLLDTCSILDNLCLNTGFPCRLGTIRQAEAVCRARLDLAKVGIDANPLLPVGELPPALKTGVAVARALREDPAAPAHLLVLDEPTATMPDREVRRLLEIVRRVASGGVGVLYVTHRLNEVFEVSDRVSVLRDGRKVDTRPTASLDRQTLVNLLVGRDFAELERVGSAATPAELSARPVLEVQGLEASPLAGVSFGAAPGEILGVAGLVGSGQETLLGAIFGAVARSAGEVRIAGQPLPPGQPARAISLGLAYLPPDRKTLGGFMALTGRENLTLTNLRPYWRRWRLTRRLEAADARSWFGRLSVRPADDGKSLLQNYSGGNQQRILFGKWLRCEPRVFLLDEPTQGVDVAAKAQLHQLLRTAAAAGMAMVVSSSDADELALLCRKVIVLRRGRIGATLEGDDISAGRITSECLQTLDVTA